MESIAITGATSMIGTALIDTAIKKGTEVYAIVRPGSNRMDRLPASPLVHVLYSQLDGLTELQDISSKCECFYHFAWAGTTRTERDDPRIHEGNVRYTLDAVELAARMGCYRFIGAGSQAEYGIVDGAINNTTRFAPTTAYGAAKLTSGILGRKRCEQLGLEHVWGRIFSVYGPHDNEGTMINTAIDDFIAGRTAHFSSATQIWNYLYETDAGEMFYRLGEKRIKPDTYFIANRESKVLKEYIQQIIEQFGETARYEFAEKTTGSVSGLNVDMTLTDKELNYYPKVSFREGIAKTVKARRKRSTSNTD